MGRALDEDGMLGALRQQRGGGVRDAIPYRWVHKVTRLKRKRTKQQRSYPKACHGSIVPEGNTMLVPAICTSP